MKYIDADKLRAWVEENKKVLNLGTRFYLENSIENVRIDETKLDILLIKDFLSYLSAEEQDVEVIKGYCKDCLCESGAGHCGYIGREQLDYCSEFEPRAVEPKVTEPIVENNCETRDIYSSALHLQVEREKANGGRTLLTDKIKPIVEKSCENCGFQHGEQLIEREKDPCLHCSNYHDLWQPKSKE